MPTQFDDFVTVYCFQVFEEDGPLPVSPDDGVAEALSLMRPDERLKLRADLTRLLDKHPDAETLRAIWENAGGRFMFVPPDRYKKFFALIRDLA